MNKQISFLFLIIFLISGVGCDKNEKNNVIPKDEFADILVDIHLMDGITYQADLRSSLLQNDTTIDYYDAVLKSHNYSRAQFDTSLVYYSKNIREFDKIYQEVLSTLNKMEAETEDELAEQKRKRKKKEKEQRERLGNPYKIKLGSKVKVKR